MARKSSAQVREALSPLALEARRKAAQSSEEAQRETITALRLQSQQGDYAATRACEQYAPVAPNHRVVARPRESRWTATGEELQPLQAP